MWPVKTIMVVAVGMIPGYLLSIYQRYLASLQGKG